MKSLKDSPLINVLIQDAKNFTKATVLIIGLLLVLLLVVSVIHNGAYLSNLLKGEPVNCAVIDSTLWFNSASVEIQTYNPGFFTKRNVMVEVSLIDENYNMLDRKSVFVGSIKGGDSKLNKVVFYLENMPAHVYIETRVFNN